MNEPNQARWAEFGALGEQEVRKRLGANVYGEEKALLANQWLTWLDSSSSATNARNTFALAQEANELARSANSAALASNSIARDASASAKRSVEAARISNTIAKAALIAAITAIMLSFIGLYLGK